MKKLLSMGAFAFISTLAMAQGVRSDLSVTQTSNNAPVGASTNVMTTPNAIVTLCGFPATGSPCTNTVQLYSDQALTQEIDNPIQADAKGRLGFWVFPGIYTYTVQTQTGVVVGNYTLSLNTIGINASPTAGQAVIQPAGTSLGVNNLNGVLNATLFAGSDLGAKVQSAITELNGFCGKITIPYGTYTWTTHKVTMLPCQKLDGNGAIVSVSTGTDPFLIVGAVPNYSSTSQYAQGGVDNITFTGPGPGSDYTSSQGILIGGDPAGVLTPTTYTAFLSNFRDVHIRNFGCGVNYGLSFQIAWFGGSFENNYDGVCFLNGGGGENMNFHGTQILNNIQYGIYSPSGGPELNLYGVSLDYNGENLPTTGAQIYTQSPYTLNIFGGHMENNYTPFILIPSGAGQATVNISDSRFTLAGFVVGPVESYLQIAGTNSIVHIDGLSVNAHVPEPASLIDFTSAGSNNRVYVRNFNATFENNNTNIPILKSGNVAQYFDYPVYDGFGDPVSATMNGINPGELTVTQGIKPGAGLQTYLVAGGCATGAAVGATCTTAAMNWPVAFVDTNYILTCSLSNPTGVPTISSVTKSTTFFTVTIAALTPADAGGDINCTAMHQ